jgi:hypothetical protein
MNRNDLEMRIAELERALRHIRAACEHPELMSFHIDLRYVAQLARDALRDDPPS